MNTPAARTEMPPVPQHSVPGAMVRVNFPLFAGGDYPMDKRDLGVCITVPGSKVTLPAFAVRQQSLVYIVKNLSAGQIQVLPAFGADGTQEVFHTSSSPATCDTLEPDQARTYLRETTSNHWIII